MSRKRHKFMSRPVAGAAVRQHRWGGWLRHLIDQLPPPPPFHIQTTEELQALWKKKPAVKMIDVEVKQ